MKLVVTVAATGSYCYAMRTLGRRVAANLQAADWTEPGVAVIAGDNSKEVREAVKNWKEALPAGWVVEHIACGDEDNSAPNYKEKAQLLIAKLRAVAFTAARRHGADYCWSLDSDTLPPANALRCMIDMLKFDRGYYSVSTCPYPNDAFLGGRGTPQNPIAQDLLESERALTDEVKAEIAELKRIAAETEPGKATEPTPEWAERKKKLDEEIKKCPALGSIWELNAKVGWRRRGWLEQAYPGIGRGAVVPSDWCGFGCTLLGKEALGLAHFEGYDGKGTEDLYIVWRCWWPAGLRINVITHCPCDHVIWSKKKGGSDSEYTLVRGMHEENGECIGHLRTQKSPWHEF